jgi:hypothetical protein
VVKYPLRVNTATFREWLSEFGKRVSKKRYKKLDYDKWRPMYLWSKPGTDWEEIEINVFDCPEMVYIVPRHTDKLSPNGIEIMLHKNSFGDYLIGVMEDYNNTVLTCSNASISAISNALSSVADATTSITYDYATNIQQSNLHDQYIGYSTQDQLPWTIDLNTDGLRVNGDSLEKYIEKTVNEFNNNKKEKENNKMMKFDFGPVDSSVHMSLYGMAIKNASGTYVAYDVKTGSIMDVDIINFEGANKFMYKMPVALSAVQIGDVIVHSKHPMFVSEVDIETNRMVAVDIYDGEEKVIVPTQSPFGFSFITKVVSLFNFAGTADASNPFGNMLPLLLMSDSKSTDKDNLLPLLFMMNGNTDMAQNPMMLWALMGNRTNDPMMLALMMGGFGAKPNDCGGNCSCHKDK